MDTCIDPRQRVSSSASLAGSLSLNAQMLSPRFTIKRLRWIISLSLVVSPSLAIRQTRWVSRALYFVARSLRR